MNDIGRRYVLPVHLDLREAFIDFELGETAHADELLDRSVRLLTDNPERQVQNVSLLAIIALTANRADIAALVRPALERPVVDIRLPSFRIRMQSLIAMITVNDTYAAASLYADLLPVRGSTVPWLVAYQISGDRLLGRLSAAAAIPEQTVQHLEDALRLCRRAGYKPELARTCHDYATWLIDRPPVSRGAVSTPLGDRSRAAALVAEGLTVAAELGMKPLVAKLELLEGKLKQSGPPTARPDGLTGWEVEVLRLIATGKSNREIGDALVISENTVARHVSNIFTKIGVANRAEAATYATRRGLIAEGDHR